VVAFAFEALPVRVVARDGDPWFVAADVCRILGLANVTMALRALDDDEKHTLSDVEGVQIKGLGGFGNSMLNVISEPGRYKLLDRSNKPEARRFDRWVGHEVLLSIRNTGAYAAPHRLHVGEARRWQPDA
jgi:prophage antirepressor-like protein